MSLKGRFVDAGLGSEHVKPVAKRRSLTRRNISGRGITFASL